MASHEQTNDNPDQENMCSECTNIDSSNFCDACHKLCLLDLPHEDVLFPHVFRRLPLSSLFQLRAVNKFYHTTVEDFFATTQQIDLTHTPPKFGERAFHIISKDTYNLRNLIVRNSKDWLTDRVLTPVIAKNPNLEKVDLTSCTCLGNLTILKLVCCTNLRELYLRDCHWLHPDSISQLVYLRGLTLERLDFSGCWEMNDKTLMVVAKCCPNLRFLSLAKIYGLTDQSMISVARNCLKLQHLNIHNCWRVTDEAIKYFGEYCKELASLQVAQCRDITEVSLARLRARGIKMDIPLRPNTLNKKHLDFLRSLKIQI